MNQMSSANLAALNNARQNDGRFGKWQAADNDGVTLASQLVAAPQEHEIDAWLGDIELTDEQREKFRHQVRQHHTETAGRRSTEGYDPADYAREDDAVWVDALEYVLGESELDEQINSSDRHVRVKAAAHGTHFTPEQAEKLSTDRFSDVRAELLRNPACPPERMNAALRGSAPEKMALAANPSAGGRLAVLAFDDHPSVRANVAFWKDNGADPSILMRLAKDSENEVRANVASHPNTPTDVLEALSSDKHPQVRARVAANHRLSHESATRLLRDHDRHVSATAACHPSITKEQQEHLASSADSQVRSRLATSDHTDFSVRKRLNLDLAREVHLRAEGSHARRGL